MCDAAPTVVPFLDRDHSILAFNERVLDWAHRPGVPLLERVRFLTIVSSNLDEFFEVRVADHLTAAQAGERKAPYSVGSYEALSAAAHRLVEKDQPITSEVLSGIYAKLLGEYWGDALSSDQRAQHTWARIPHFFQSPYYVYQYATCFASTAKLMEEIGSADAAVRGAAVDRYLKMLQSGGSDHPMVLLKNAGVDLSKPETVRAVSSQLDGLVDRLERELA